MKMLTNNKNSVYGREYNFESFKNSKDFMAAHPLTTKSHYTDYTGKCDVYKKKATAVFHTIFLRLCKYVCAYRATENRLIPWGGGGGELP